MTKHTLKDYFQPRLEFVREDLLPEQYEELANASLLPSSGDTLRTLISKMLFDDSESEELKMLYSLVIDK